MQHQRHAHRLEGRPASWGRAAVAEGGSWLPFTREKLTPPRSKSAALLDHARDPAAAFGALPCVALERAAVERASSAATMSSCRATK